MRKIVLVLLLAAMAQPALAHARLVGSEPVAGGQAKEVEKVVLHFSENLEPAFSGAQLMDGADKAVTVVAAVRGSDISLVMPKLKAGHYSVRWHSVGQDTHRMEGSFQFTVLP